MRRAAAICMKSLAFRKANIASNPAASHIKVMPHILIPLIQESNDFLRAYPADTHDTKPALIAHRRRALGQE